MSGLLPLAVGLGLVYGLLAAEFLGVAAAGLVVPGYLALLLDKPLWLGGLLAASLAVFAVLRLLARHTLLFGRRRAALALLLGYTASVGLGVFLGGAGAEQVFGFLVPGLVALWMDRQGLLETLCGLTLLTILVRLSLLILFGAELGT